MGKDSKEFTVVYDDVVLRDDETIEIHAKPGTGLVCGAANDCTRLKGHKGKHANLYNGRRWGGYISY